MLFDDENDILDFFRYHMLNDLVLHFNGNSFNRKIEHCLLDEKGLISDNSHASLPPDFYSIIHNMMFDVLRINDSEVKKKYNPVKIRERKRYNEILQKFDDIFEDESKIMILSESDNIGEHLYKNYVKNAYRVINEHIQKIALWEKKCSNIKYKGLFVFDETEVYYEGISMPSGYSNPDYAWLRGIRIDCGLHKPWLDAKFIQQIYESSIDFVVWFCPYKPFGIARRVGIEFPGVVIIDTRFCFKDYVTYPDSLVC